MGWPWSAATGGRGMMAAAAVLLAGCSQGVGGLGSIGSIGPATVAYQHSNMMMATGYTEELLGPDRYRITVTGYAHTPRERLEKIAQTRAAEIGTEMKLGAFKIENVALATKCEKYKVGVEKGGVGQQKAELYNVLTADVVYAKVPPDTSYVSAKEAFPQLKAELDAQNLPPMPPDPLAQCS